MSYGSLASAGHTCCSRHFLLPLLTSWVMLVPMPGIAATLTLTPVADATLYEETATATANGAGDFLFAGRTNQPAHSRRRSLLRFDLNELPVDSVITAVSLRLFLFSVSTAETQVYLQPLTAAWTIGPSNPTGNETAGVAAVAADVTWNHASFDQSLWISPGGDASGPPSASLSVGTDVAFHTWTGPSLTADVAAWAADPTQNFGWVLRDSETSPQTAKRFGSGDHADPSMRPALTIEFTSIPEPSAASLLLAAFGLLWRRTRPTARSQA